MPLAFSPDCVFMAKTSLTLLSRLQLNLKSLFGADGVKRPELINWRSKYAVEVLDSCLIELVQVEGMSMVEEAPLPTTEEDNMLQE